MKTLKALKITSILNSIFCFFCISFVICIITIQYYRTDVIVAIGVISTYGWMLNPTPIISFIICLKFFLNDRHSAEAKQIIGRKYIWIFVQLAIATVFYFIAMGFLVEITGGV